MNGGKVWEVNFPLLKGRWFSVTRGVNTQQSGVTSMMVDGKCRQCHWAVLWVVGLFGPFVDQRVHCSCPSVHCYYIGALTDTWEVVMKQKTMFQRWRNPPTKWQSLFSHQNENTANSKRISDWIAKHFPDWAHKIFLIQEINILSRWKNHAIDVRTFQQTILS